MGKGLVINSLLLSRVWHCLPTISVPVSFLQTLRSIVICFLSQHSFPFVSHVVCQRPRKEGGLAVLNLGPQLCTLQLRWLRPLLIPPASPVDDDSFALPTLCYCLCSFSNTADPIMPLVFEDLWTLDVKALGFCWLLFRMIDKMDYSVNWDKLNLSVVLELPLSKAIPELLAMTYKGWVSNWHQLYVKNTFTFSPVSGSLIRKQKLSGHQV